MATTLYIRTTGNDNNSGTIGSPFRTAQKAFETAYFGAGDYILDFGSGSFSGVNLQTVIDPSTIQKFSYINETFAGGGSLIVYKSNSNTYNGNCGDSFIRGVSNWTFTDINGNTFISSDNPIYPWLATFPTAIFIDNIYPLTPIKNVPIYWPYRISIRGVSPNSTFLGDIIGTGSDNSLVPNCNGLYDFISGTNASNINLSASNIKIGNVYGNGAGYLNDLGGYNGTNGGIISLTGCYFNNINIIGGGGASGGTTFLYNCSGLDILANGYFQDGYDPNTVIGATAGSVILQNSIVRNINSYAVDSSSYPESISNGINGGNVTLTQNSSATNIYTYGSTAYSFVGGNGGNIILNSSTAKNLYLYGGSGTGGCGSYGGTQGTLTNINSTITGIISAYNGGPLYGCTNVDGCNYNSSASCEDNSCTFPDYCYDCSGNCTCVIDCINGCGGGAYSGCTDSSACNYDSGAYCEDGSCTYTCNNPTARNYHDSCGNNCWYVDCNDSAACNYDSNSFGTSECTYACNNPTARNYHTDCNGCWYVDCNDSSACNYDSNSFGSSECSYPSDGCHDCGGNCICSVDVCGICGGSSYAGCINPSACNYDPSAGCDDGSCLFYACDGNCTSSTPTLYPDCGQSSITSSVLNAYRLGILPIPSNNPAIKNRLLAEIINFPLILQGSTTVVNNGLLVHLDAGNPSSYSGGSTWTDLKSGIVFDLYNSPNYDSNFGGSLFFTPSASNYARSQTSLPNLSSWTLETWHYYNNTNSSGFPTIITQEYNGDQYLNFNLGPDTLGDNKEITAGYFNAPNGYWHGTTNGIHLSANSWNHLVGTYDGSHINLYINGTLTSSVASTIPSIGNGRSILLMRRWDSNEFWGGNLGVVKIYDKALNGSQVLYYYNNKKNRFIIPPFDNHITFNNTISAVVQTPFGTGSVYSFNGSTQYITIGGDYIYADPTTGDFTVEWYQYATGTNSHIRPFSIGHYPSALIDVSYEGSLYVNVDSGGAGYGTGTYSPTLNQWQHIAIVRQSGIITAYVDGVKLGNAFGNTSDVNSSTTPLTIGTEDNLDSGSFFNGYITNFRWTRKAVYTGNFTAPTSPLTLTQAGNGGNIQAIENQSLVKVLLVP